MVRLFVGTLDYKYCLCIMDLFLLEGNCLLYRGEEGRGGEERRRV